MTLPEINNLIQVARIDRQDGVSIGLTEFNNDIVIEGLTYSASGSFDPRAASNSVNLATDNSEIQLLFNNDQIKPQELIAGLYEEAVVTVAFINFVNLPATLEDGIIILRGRVGEVRFTEDTFTMEVRSYSELLGRSLNNKVTPICRWQFGDSKCKFDLAANNLFLPNLTVNSFGLAQNVMVLGTSLITPDFVNGILTFKSGNNNGLRFEIAEVSGTDTVTVLGELVGDIQLGDVVDVQAYCARTQEACTNQYNNFVNFGGFPRGGNFIPGLSRITAIPD